jgi:multiple sugar transport system substrate-binding protein
VIPRRRFLAGLGALAVSGCHPEAGEERPPGERARIVFKHSPMGGDPAALRGLLAAFERDHPGVEVQVELLPSAAGTVHQYYLTSLEGKTRDFDVFIIDVVWVAEFARAGWIADLSRAFSPDAVRRDFLPGAAEAVIVQDRTFAVPWFVDAGVLFRRSDRVPVAPATYADLVSACEAARSDGYPRGYLWQALQSEGLVCNVYEAIWGFGGQSMSGGRVLLDTPEARAALEYLRGLVTRGISPASVTSMAEEESRRTFQSGRALMMRNWPYAWAEAQRPDSPVRGKVAVSALPTLNGDTGQGALGGFQLALNPSTPAWKAGLALELIAHLTSPEANLLLALAYGRCPSRSGVYSDPRLEAGAPLIASLLPIVVRARPRPVTPYYPMINDTLAAEFSAAVTGVRSPAEALRRAQELVDHLMRGVR